MTPTRNAGFVALAGLLCLCTGGALAQTASPPQNPAPTVRISPYAARAAQPHAPAAATPLKPGPRSAAAQAAAAPAKEQARPRASVADAKPGEIVEHRTATLAADLNRTVIVLDPGHGGTDSGARIGDSTLEKNVTLALAFRLRSLLVARGFDVVLTRDSDTVSAPNNPAAPLTLDDRAGMANHARAAACLLLHATGRGVGVHLYSSELDPAPEQAATPSWLTAQAPWVPASQALEQQIGAALGRSHVALVSSTASVRPMDSLTCPALVVELAPSDDDDPNSVNDAGYQERVAAAMAGALVFWKDAVQAPPRAAPRAAALHGGHHAASPPAPSAEIQP